MPTTFQLAEEGVTRLLNRAMREYHPRLSDAGVKVGIIMAYNPDGPAIKRTGHGVLAQIKPIPLKDRLTKGYDAELLIDEREYRDLRPEQRLALMDHELRHLDTIDLSPKGPGVARLENPNAPAWKTDDIGRPKLRSVPGNWDAGDGFRDVVSRHGADAIEYRNLKAAWGYCDRAAKAGADGQDVDPAEDAA